jgi:hypothetical protein
MRLLCPLLAALVLASCRSNRPTVLRSAAGDPLAEGRTYTSGGASWMVSVPGEVADFEVASARVGLERFVRQGLSLGGELGVHSIDGAPSAGGDSDTSGVSTNALVRWHALQGRGWSAFLEFGVGVLASEAPFPVGGTRWNGVRQAGVGVELELTPQLRLGAGVRQQHVSNGKGLVDDNPAWEGQGAYVGLHFDITPRGALQQPTRTMTLPEAEPWSARVEARGGEYGDDDHGGGGVVALDSQLYGAWFGQLRGSLDRVDGEALGEYGVALYLRTRSARIGVAYDRQELDVFADDEFSIFAEWLANDITTVSSVVGRELRSHFEDRNFAGVTLRFYVLDSLAIDSGIVARAEPDEFRADAVNVPLGFEYAFAPELLPGLSLFAQKDLQDDQSLVGLRWTTSPGATARRSLRERDFSNGPLRQRP